MRIALASPYWSVPGGVNRHVSNWRALHPPRPDVRVIAPHRSGLRVQPDYLNIIGHSSIGLPASGSVANSPSLQSRPASQGVPRE